MMNMDNVSALGETTSLVKDLSLTNISGTVNGAATRTGNGKRNGAYIFNGSSQTISTNTRTLGTSATIIARGKTAIVDPAMLWNYPVDGSVTYFDLWLSNTNKIFLNMGDGTGNPFMS